MNAAKPGDWVLIAPGDYKTTTSSAPAGENGEFPAGVLITTPRIVVRGMNRDTVIVDGTKPGTPPCSDGVNDQSYGATTTQGSTGLNGLMVWKADNVWIQNLTACNFLGGAGGDGQTGNEIWWNGGAESGAVGGWGYYGSYLNATSTFYNTAQTPLQAEATAAEYGIFSSNWNGGTWDNTYASNFNDSGYYIGACQDECNQVVDHAWAEYNALGYSGSNSGGSLVVENSQFDNNEDGFDTNSQNGDNPPPQDGTCPDGTTSPITHTHSCWVFMNNNVHDNNDPNVPTAGFAAAGPVGTGMSLSGARDDTVMDNTFANNGAWGNIVVPFPTSGAPCTGGVTTFPAVGCLFDEWGDAIVDNHYVHNGYFGNPTNGDFEQFNFESGEPTNCFSGNTDAAGSLPSEDQQLQSSYPVCNGAHVAANLSPGFLLQVACDSGLALVGSLSVPCLPGTSYPRFTSLQNGLHPLPPASALPTMPHVCAGVPANPWCQGQTVRVGGCAAATTTLKLSVPVGESFTGVVVDGKRYAAHGSSVRMR
ncbi:MAG TPA: hypothetical protein VG223_01855, partial [Solirubrobacteraceae bacterium]|nr:hypothetical protein [Solirubrobacteraceae bacterium]